MAKLFCQRCHKVHRVSFFLPLDSWAQRGESERAVVPLFGGVWGIFWMWTVSFNVLSCPEVPSTLLVAFDVGCCYYKLNTYLTQFTSEFWYCRGQEGRRELTVNEHFLWQTESLELAKDGTHFKLYFRFPFELVNFKAPTKNSINNSCWNLKEIRLICQ